MRGGCQQSNPFLGNPSHAPYRPQAHSLRWWDFLDWHSAYMTTYVDRGICHNGNANSGNDTRGPDLAEEQPENHHQNCREKMGFPTFLTISLKTPARLKFQFPFFFQRRIAKSQNILNPSSPRKEKNGNDNEKERKRKTNLPR